MIRFWKQNPARPLDCTSVVAGEYRDLFEARRRELIRVNQPMALISQAGRSGGSLLMRLFDGHPECHTVPHELGRIVLGMSEPLTDANSAWTALTQENRHDASRMSYRQAGPYGLIHGSREHLPFLLPASLQRALFNTCADDVAEWRDRAVVDAYLTAYFNAWLNNRNLHGTQPKRFVVGFEPGFVRKRKKTEAFARIYPDGRVISLVRDPWTWFASARRWSPRRWGSLDDAVGEWLETVEAALEWQRSRPDMVRIVCFADLLERTEETMRALTRWLGIAFEPELLTPTFNGLPVAANSSYEEGTSTQVSRTPLSRAQSDLTQEERATIDERTADLYRHALAAAIDVEPATDVEPTLPRVPEGARGTAN